MVKSEWRHRTKNAGPEATPRSRLRSAVPVSRACDFAHLKGFEMLLHNFVQKSVLDLTVVAVLWVLA